MEDAASLANRQTAQQSILDELSDIGQRSWQTQVEVIAVLSQRTKDAAEQRRWMTVQVMAMAGFVVPLLLSQPTLRSVAGYVWAGAGSLILALAILFVWDIVDEFLSDPVLAAAMAENRAQLDHAIAQAVTIGMKKMTPASKEWEERYDVAKAKANVDRTQADSRARAARLRRARTAFRVASGVLILFGLVMLASVVTAVPDAGIAPK